MKQLLVALIVLIAGAASAFTVRTAFTSYRTTTTPYRSFSQRQQQHLADSLDSNTEFVSSSSWDTEVSLSELQKLTVPQLKQQLRLRGLKVGGKKSELVERLLAFSAKNDAATTENEDNAVEPEVMDEVPKSKARKFAEAKGKELIDVTAYLDEDDKDKDVKSSIPQDSKSSSKKEQEEQTAEIWGTQAKIVDDYEGRSVVVDNLSRTIVEYIGSNQTSVQAYVVASRDALQAFLAGGGQNTTKAEERLVEIQTRREQAAKVPVRSMEDDPGLEGGDDEGIYTDIIERDFSDWGKFTQTGAQLSAAEVQGVLLLSDVCGAFTDDTRALAEKIAFECQPVVVMVPDLFREHAWQEESAGLNAEGQNYEQWRETHGDLRVSVDIRAAAACLRERYGVSSVVVWGTCYGGGRALEAASNYFPGGNIHDVNGQVGPPPVNPLAAVAWYPTRYNAKLLFGSKSRRHRILADEGNRTVAIMSIFASEDTIAGATPDDAAELKSLLEVDERVNDYMVKVFPGQEHGFAHIGLGSKEADDSDDFERFVDEEFGGSGRVAMDGGDAEVACLLSTAWMETYSRVFLPTTGPPISVDEQETEWSDLEMKDLGEANNRNIREEIDDALDKYVDPPLSGRYIDHTDESKQEELQEILKGMQSRDELGEFKIEPDDDLATMYAKLKASDENFQIF